MNSVHTATTSGPLTAVSGLRVTLNAIAASVIAPTAMRTGVNEMSDRIRLRRRTARKRPTKRSAR